MCVSFFLCVLADWVGCGKSVVRSWEPLTLVWGPLHKRTVNKLEGIFILRSKQLNRLLFLGSVMITEIKWKASLSEGKKTSTFLNPFLMQVAFSWGCSIYTAPGDAFHNQSDEPFETSELGFQCLKNHRLFTLKTIIRVYQQNVSCFPIPKPHNPLFCIYQKYVGVFS